MSAPAEEFGSVDEVGAEDVCRVHSVLDHQFELAGLRSVREGADVAAYGKGDTCGHLFFELGGVVDLLGAFAGCSFGCVGVVGEVLGYGEGWDCVDLFVVHGLHGGFA